MGKIIGGKKWEAFKEKELKKKIALEDYKEI
jgi:hypothetical protein